MSRFKGNTSTTSTPIAHRLYALSASPPNFKKPHLCFHTLPSYSGKLPVTDTRAAEFGNGFVYEAIKIVDLQLIEMSSIHSIPRQPVPSDLQTVPSPKTTPQKAPAHHSQCEETHHGVSILKPKCVRTPKTIQPFLVGHVDAVLDNNVRIDLAFRPCITGVVSGEQK